MKPSIMNRNGSLIFVPEQYDITTEKAIALGATRLTLAEILSRFSQSKPVEDLRLIGEVSAHRKIKIEGAIGQIRLELWVSDPDGIERYKLRAAHGWAFGVFSRDRFSTICVIIDGVSVPLDLEVLR